MWLLRRRPRSRSRPISTEGTAGRSAASAASGYRTDGSQVNWEISGGATRKARRCLPTCCRKAGRAAPRTNCATAVAGGRQGRDRTQPALSHRQMPARGLARQARARRRQREHLLRDGSRYILVPPERSWLDISTFEQLCRQSHSHIKSGASDEALICLQATDRLYTGDIFQDIPADYADNTEHDWCWSKRYGCATCTSRCSATPRAFTANVRIFRPRWRIVGRRSPSIPCARLPMKRRCGCFARRGGAKRSIGNTSSIGNRSVISTIGRKAPGCVGSIGSWRTEVSPVAY